MFSWIAIAAACRAPVIFKRHALIDILSSFPMSMSKENHPLLVFPDYDMLLPDADPMIFGPLDDDHALLSPHTWDHPRDYAFNSPVSPIMSDQTMSPRRASDFDIPDASPTSSFYDSVSFDVPSILDLDDSHLSHWLQESQLPGYDPSSSSPIPIRGTQPDPQSPPAFMPYGLTSFSPSDLAAHSLPRSLSPTETSDGGYLSSPGLRLASISPADTSLRPPQWASHLWDPSQYSSPTSARPPATRAPLCEHPYTAKRQRFQPRREASTSLVFQPSSAPSPLQSPMTRSYSRRAESVSVTEDRDATIRRKKKSPPLQDEPPKDAKSLQSRMFLILSVILILIGYHSSHQVRIETAQISTIRLATLLYRLDPTPPSNQHSQAQRRPGCQRSRSRVREANARAERSTPHFIFVLLLFDTLLQPYKQRSLILKQARERENESYLRSLTPEDIKRENAFRTAQRKAGRSRKSNLKDPNAPKKPLSAYFMFLQHIRSEPVLVRQIFGDEQETTKQSVLAAAKWRSMTDDERKVCVG